MQNEPKPKTAENDNNVVFLFFLINLLVGLIGVGKPGLYLDESASIWHTQMEGGDFLAFLGRDGNPPLYYLLLRGWMGLFGDGIAAVRALSAIFIAGTAGLTTLIAHRHGTRVMGTVAGFLFTFSNIHHHFAQEARTFALVAFLGAASFYFFLEWMENARRRDLVLLGLANVLLLYSHYASIALLLAQGFASLPVIGMRPGRFLPYVACQIGVGLAFVPALVGLFTEEKLSHTAKWLQPPDADGFFSVLRAFSGSPAITWIALGAVGLSLGSLVLRYRRQALKPSDYATYVFFCWSLVSLVIAYIISQWVPLFLPKYLLFAATGWILLLAACAESGNALAPVAVVIVIVASILTYKHQQPRQEDWKAATEAARIAQHDGAIIVTPDYQLKSFAFYYDKEAFRQYREMSELMLAHKVMGMKRMSDDFFEYQQHDRYVLLQSHRKLTDPEDVTRKMLSEKFDVLKQQAFRGIQMTVFGKKNK